MINASWFNSPVERAAFNAFACHKQTIENFIEILIKSDDPNAWHNQAEAMRKSGLNLNSLTSDEIKYIEREVSKRC